MQNHWNNQGDDSTFDIFIDLPISQEEVRIKPSLNNPKILTKSHISLNPANNRR